MGIPRDWTSSLIAGGLMLVPPDGPKLSSIRIRERITPIEKFSVLVERTLPRLRALTPDLQIGAREKFVTDEGEHGVMQVFSGTGALDKVPIESAIAVVYGDEFYDRFDAYVTGTADQGRMAPVMHDFLRERKLGLGRERHRRYRYTPPPKWIGITRGLLTEWLHPEFPKRRSRILVAPAMPEKDQPASEVANTLFFRILPSFQKSGRQTREGHQSATGLNGIYYHMQGTFTTPDSPETDLVGCVFRDDEYIYPLRLRTEAAHLEEEEEVFKKLLDTVEPVPRRKSRVSDVFVHWSD